MNERDQAYLHHIRDCCIQIREYTAIGRSGFLASRLHQDAVIRNFQIIGEASKKLSVEARALGSFPWQDLPSLEAHVKALLES